MRKTIQVGTSDFKEIIEKNHYFVDKTLLIKEFFENGSKVILIPRPRRFGKTLNMSMLKYFFDIEMKKENRGLFKGFNIEKDENIMKEQGQYPVIFLTFKNQIYSNFKEFKYGLKMLFSSLYKDHMYLLESDKIIEEDKMKFKRIVSEKGEIIEYYNALSELMKYMSIHYNKKVMVFIDEYDVPVQQSYNKGYYDEAIDIIKVILTSALKDNKYLEKALVTGILRIARESIFSGLNNIQIHTMFSHKFNDKFGFTIGEVKQLLQYYGLEGQESGIRKWYNGYIFSGEIIYNPWSVLNYICDNENGFVPYWLNTGSNDLIKRLLVKGNDRTKKSLESLISGNSIEKIIDDNIVMSEVEKDDENLWSFLTLSGYLKPVEVKLINGQLHCKLKIPNNEVLIFYQNIIKKWFSESITRDVYNDMLQALTSGNLEVFEELFTDFVLDNMSYFDVSGKEPEKVYHAFVLGMLVSLSEKYEVNSNKESGYGRYDVMIIPKDTSKIGIIIEFKKIRETNSKTIETGIQEALKQIEEKQYERELRKRNVKNVLKIAIVFKGKKIRIAQKRM